ncbi:MAG: T9SS type A sorting domain-containing protein [Candidatus Hatepunaea meridiana]|nr:T9SS type A sorting domain-containing protein [Candidatus Hatepunaea meridiana]
MKKNIDLLIIFFLIITTPLFADSWNISRLAEVAHDHFFNIKIQDDIAYCSTTYGLVVMDVSDKENPEVINRIPLENSALGIELRDTLLYLCASKDHVKLAVYDLSGREVAVLFEGVRTPGEYSVSWKARDLPSGIYMFKLTGENRMSAMKVALVK